MDAKILKNKLVCVEYPGVIEDENKMLQTLGSEENISEVYRDPVKRLELKWRPQDKFCKPACGDRFSSHKMLLKVTRKKRPDEGGSEVTGGSEEMTAEILGIAETAFKFECLADYQYLAVKHDPECGGYETFYDTIVPGPRPITRKEWMNVEDPPLFLPSPLYARMDRPQDYAYKDRPKERKERTGAARDQPDSVIIVDRAKRQHFSKFHSFVKGEVPTGPYPEAQARLVRRPSYRFDKPKLELLQKCFEERPLWTRTALQCVAKISQDQLKFILPLVAYYWEAGPWRTMWCKFGFDPRKEPSAKIYQLVDFRVRGVRFDNISIKRSSTKEFQLPHKVVRTQAQAAAIRHSHLQAPQEDGEEEKTTDMKEHLWKFRREVLPEQRQLFYSVADVEVPEVQDVIHSNDGEETECTEKDGWLVPGYADKIRAIMTSIVEEQLGRNNLDIKEEEVLSSKTTRKRRKRRGKAGAKHQAKSSAAAATAHPEQPPEAENGTEAELDDTVDTSQMTSRDEAMDTSEAMSRDDGDVMSGSDSDSLASDLEELESRELGSQRTLRTRKVLETTDFDVSDNEFDDEETGDRFAEDFLDSDDDPEYNPESDVKGEG